MHIEVKLDDGTLWRSRSRDEVKKALISGTIRPNQQAKKLPLKNQKKEWHALRDVLADEWDLLLLYNPIEAMVEFFGALIGILALIILSSMHLGPVLQDLGVGVGASYLWSFFFVTTFFTLIGHVVLAFIFFWTYKIPYGLSLTWSVLKAIGWGLLAAIAGFLMGAILGAFIGSFIKPRVVDPDRPHSLLGKLKSIWDETK